MLRKFGKRAGKLGLQKYEDLTVWQKAMDFVAEIYKIAKLIPDSDHQPLVTSH
jgi:hypothetical protein